MPDTPNPRAIEPRWAWEPYRPSDANPWDLKKVGHLHRRAAFGATTAELQASLRDGPERAIDNLIRGGSDAERFERDSDALLPGITDGNDGNLATAWWLYRILYSPHPLREKLTLFWHNHFATSNLKVNNAGFMIGQYQLMREHAQGSFRSMLLLLGEDPAMLVWLDTNSSQRRQPNENYARELMELFTLGIHNLVDGRRNYTEQDVREAARAFTGWRIVSNRAVFQRPQHDDGEKNVFGQRGRWQGRDIARLCLDQPATAYFIVSKLFRFLISDMLRPTHQLLEPLATEFRRSDYNFGALVERVLRSNLFFSSHAYRNKIKSPVEFVGGIIRGLEGRVGTTVLATALEGLGQRLFNPPSVAGWEGGEGWLNGQTLLFRHNLALALTSTEDDRFNRRCDPVALTRRHTADSDEGQVNLFLEVFLQRDVPAAARTRLLDYLRRARTQRVPFYWTEQDAANQRVRALCHLVLTLPEFQLC